MSRFHGLSAVVPLGLPKGMPGLQWVSEQGGGLRVDGYDGYDARARFADQVQRSSLVGEGVKSSKFSQEVVFVRHVSNVSRGRAPYLGRYVRSVNGPLCGVPALLHLRR